MDNLVNAPDNRKDAFTNDVVVLTGDNWRKELMLTKKPVMVLTTSMDCSSCDDWQKQWANEAKQHPEFKYAISDATTFHLPENMTPIMSIVEPTIGTTYMQSLNVMGVDDSKKFWEERRSTARVEQQQVKDLNELQQSQNKLLIDVWKYAQQPTHSAEDQKQFASEQIALASASNKLVEVKTKLQSEINQDVDPAIIKAQEKPE